MPVSSLSHVPVYAWIPPTYGGQYKVEIVGDSTIDITDYILEGEVIDGCTDTIGSFNFLLDNSDESRTGIWTGNEIINLYMDYAVTATTKRFKGKIEKVSYQDNQIKISGRSESAILLDVTVTKSYSDTTSNIILDLFSTYASQFTVTNVNTESTSVTFNWYQKPMWDCIRELCRASGFDCYVDYNSDVHYFESGSVNNETDCIVHDSNLFEVGDFAYDYSLIKNRIIVYGANIGDFPLIATSEDLTSQSANGIKELIINDTNITTYTQAKERADYELNLSKDPPLVGDVVSNGLASIQPGENLRISCPYSNLNPAYYKIVSFRHSFGDFFETTVTIEKEPKAFYHVMRDRISTEQKLAEQPNPYEMRQSYNFDFDSDTGLHSNTIISDGVLKATSSSGYWTSDLKTEITNITSCILKVKGSSIVGTTYFVSTDSGVSWQSITPDVIKTLSPTGLYLRIKVQFASTSTEIESLVLLYK